MGFDLTFEKIVYIWRRLVESEKFMKRIKDIIKKNEGLNRNFLNLGIIESRNYIRISYGSFLYAGTNGISPFS
jgi:hypothetical protein